MVKTEKPFHYVLAPNIKTHVGNSETVLYTLYTDTILMHQAATAYSNTVCTVKVTI